MDVIDRGVEAQRLAEFLLTLRKTPGAQQSEAKIEVGKNRIWFLLNREFQPRFRLRIVMQRGKRDPQAEQPVG